MNYPNNYVVFDIETTGLKASEDKIIEIGALKYENNILVDKFSYLINPKVKLPEIIKGITGITDEILIDKPTIEEVLPKFIDFVGDYAVIGHNVYFDISFINYNAKILGLKLISGEVIDTLKLARIKFKDTKNHKLQTLKEYLNLDFDSHRAVDDCFTCNEVYNYCRGLAEKQNI